MNDLYKQGYQCLCARHDCGMCTEDWNTYFFTAKYVWNIYVQKHPFSVYESLNTKREGCFGIADDLEYLFKKDMPSEFLLEILKETKI